MSRERVPNSRISEAAPAVHVSTDSFGVRPVKRFICINSCEYDTLE